MEHQNKLLTHYAAEIEKLTLMQERNRMSKELHDTLGHSFISLIMSLDASIALMDRKPVEVKDRLIRLRALAEQNLDEMRNIVHEMGEEDEESTLIQQVEALMVSFQEHTGTVLTLKLLGAEQPMRFEVRQVILRVIQETLTNALKHGNASQLHLEFLFSESILQLSIQNNGKPIDKLEYGFGLTSMKHRVEQLGGRLFVSSMVGTTVITEIKCEIPLKGAMLHGEN